MAVPKRKTSKAKKRSRRTHQGIKIPNIIFDQSIGEYRLSHHVSPSGHYNHKRVIAPNA